MSARIESWDSVEELALMTLGTDKGAWHADPNFGSDLWLLRREGKVDGATAGRLERTARESLQWLVSDGLVRSVECRAERNGKSRIDFAVTLTNSSGESRTVKEVLDVV